MAYFTNFKRKVLEIQFREILNACSNNNKIYSDLFFIQRFEQKCQFGSPFHPNWFLILLCTKIKAENILSAPADVTFTVISCSITKSSFDKKQSFNTEKDFHQSKMFTSCTTLSSNKDLLNGSKHTMNFKRIAIKDVSLKFSLTNSVALFFPSVFKFSG